MWRMIAGVAAGLVLLSGAASACESMTFENGRASCRQLHSRVDAQGREWPVRIQITRPPAHGTVTTQPALEHVTLRSGERRTVHATQVVFRPKKGYLGEDTFTYVRITDDPTDRNNGKSFTIAVTMR